MLVYECNAARKEKEKSVSLEWNSSAKSVVLTLSDAKSSEDAQFKRRIAASSVDRWLVGPEAKPIVVCKRGGLLEGTEEDDGHDEGKADGAEVFSVHLQLYL